MSAENDPAVLLARGNAALASGDAAAAAACYRAALAQQPGHPGLLYNLGNALRATGELSAAEHALRESLTRDPAQPAARNNLGNLLRTAGRPQEALEEYRRALHLDPGDGRIRGNLGTALMDLLRPEEAAVWFAQAAAAAPADAQAQVNLGGALMLAGRPREALATYRRARASSPGLPGAGLGEAIALLTLGDWRAGWEAYEARLRDPRFRPYIQDMPGRRWHGPEAVAGRSLLLVSEQGLGDTLQFCRYAPLLRARGARVLLQVQPPLVPLLRGLADHVGAPGEPLPAFDLWCPLMSLPRAFGTTEATVPPMPGLAPDPARRRRWARRLGPRTGLRVGLARAGNRAHGLDGLRSLPEAALAPLLRLPGIEAHALQPEARPADPRIRAHPDIADFADAAALVSLMDVVVSVDTAVAHLAGSLGQRTWMLLSAAPDFRWMLDRADTPWYASVRLVRQERLRQWDGAVAAVAAALGELLGKEQRWRRAR